MRLSDDCSEMASDRIRQNLSGVLERIAAAAARSGRPAGDVKLVAVTKKWPVELVRIVIEAGARDLGENYPQELWKKAETLSDRGSLVNWHLIGHLQSNKAGRTLRMVKMIHAVDSLKLLQHLDSFAARVPAPPSVCLQVNTSGEETKHGWTSEQVLQDCDAIAACKTIPIVGLMTMAAWGTDADSARPSFIQLRETCEKLRRRTGLPLVELSMGMSCDFESAIEEGATLVRIGSALLEGLDA
jgi:pyridoxal phosphate enzyme (YggS family)